MDLDDPLEQASQFAAAAFAAMARLGVAPTPYNFLIWYSHCAGRDPELSEALLTLEASGAPFSPSRCAELYERFFGTLHQVRLIDETCERIEATMGRLLDQVEGMATDAGAYGQRLADFSDKLSSAAGSEGLRGLMAKVLEETRAMLGRARHLEGELAQSAAQMTSLRADLASAQREANTDSLTRIANRRCFDRELQLAAEQAQVRQTPLCLLMADLDHFKAVNDSYGHQIGDHVLRLVAQVLTSCVKGRDIAARYGGEEFAVILPQTTLDGARALAEQIRRAVATHRIRFKASGRELGRITLSIGCAQYRTGEPIAELIQRADEALYHAKRLGRNRVAVAARPIGTFAVRHSVA
jgi:diguanylate cyclase